MKPLYLFSLLAALLSQGCYIAKINGNEKLVEVSRLHKKKMSISLIDKVVPRLDIRDGYGALSLTAHGDFSSSYVQQYEVHCAGNQYKAIGLFPGFDHYCEAQSTNKDGSYYASSFLYPIGVGIANCFLGLPTIYTIIESIDSSVAKKESSKLFFALGIIGTYKYESDPYDINTKCYKFNDKCRQIASLRLKGYKVRIDGHEYTDVDGVVRFPFVSKDNVVKFRLLQMPVNFDEQWRETCKTIIQNDYVVHVNKGERKEIDPAVDRTSDNGEVIEYIVQRGDYLAKISKKFNATISSIKKLNPWMGDRDILRVGQKLKIPVNNDVR